MFAIEMRGNRLMSGKMSAERLVDDVPSPRVREILETGARLFAEKGYEATSMRDISDAAGVSKALLYHHFKSKEDIYGRIAFAATQHLNTFVKSRIPTEGTAAEKLRAFMVSTATFFSEHRSAWIAASNAFWSDPDQRATDLRIAYRRQFENMLREIIRDGVASGEFNEVDPAGAGRLVLSGINWMHRWYDPEKAMSAEEIVDQYADILLCGIARK
ncbi:TetR/AcrR family transcriptional regulator [Rhizobium sp. L1K21]|uniref:TetR/AcrR family transcriptional regulator n=1 Tax=Rhizobium sp. L1K21 TaxID=2954933 RepID=UPI0020922470|nr:TetR/AcrR family transcriptional regulator [Rhizobium sp. L1K21]MCO6188487.1 TetR/AcrR family transcriptional regulator [Rhizobium sp. L1K21]